MKYKLEMEIIERPGVIRCKACDLCIYAKNEIYCAPMSDMVKVDYSSQKSRDDAYYALLDKCPLEVVL